MDTSNKSTNNFAIPVAIVIAGALIAGAVFFSNSGQGVPDGTVPGEAKVQALETVLSKIAKASGINTKDFDKCLASGKYTQAISDSVGKAGATGGNGTPWTIVVSDSGKKYPISGAQSIEGVKSVIDTALKEGDPSAAVTAAVSRSGMSAAEVAVAKQNLEKTLPNMVAVTSADHIKGSLSASVKIVEYSDLECPFCKRFHTTMQEVMNTYNKDGKVAWVFRHFPLAQLHSKAPKEAEATECAAELGGNDGFWKFVDKINEITPSNNKLDQALI
ncbi:MAG TPA: thioredoxin domain-containing protein [Candidatus Paceibacterota bacterium]